MHRAGGDIAGEDVLEAESQADLLAFELLAPEVEVWRAVPKGLGQRPFSDRKTALERLLIHRFGLPSEAARTYSNRLCYARFGGRSVRDLLGIT
jgi:hypothetical protein